MLSWKHVSDRINLYGRLCLEAVELDGVKWLKKNILFPK